MVNPLERPEPKRWLEDITHLLRWACRLEEVLLIAILTGMVSMAVVQIGMRTMFHYGLVWGDGLVKMLVLWVCILGAMVAVRQEKHIQIDLLARYLPIQTRKIFRSVVYVFSAGICFTVAYYGVQFVKLEYTYKTLAFSAVPAWICETIIPFGFTVMAFRFIILTLKQFNRSRAN